MEKQVQSQLLSNEDKLRLEPVNDPSLIILLDLNYTLVSGRPTVTQPGPTYGDKIPHENYRLGLVELIKGHTVLLYTVRKEAHRDITLRTIAQKCDVRSTRLVLHIQRKDRRRTAARICANAVICGSLVIVRDDNGGNRTRAGAIASDHHLARRQTWRNELDATSKKCGNRRARMLTIAPKRKTMRPDAYRRSSSRISARLAIPLRKTASRNVALSTFGLPANSTLSR